MSAPAASSVPVSSVPAPLAQQPKGADTMNSKQAPATSESAQDKEVLRLRGGCPGHLCGLPILPCHCDICIIPCCC